jgi:protein-tyrosine-phosphatase
MQEVGIDLRGHHPKSVDQFLRESFDYVITVRRAKRPARLHGGCSTGCTLASKIRLQGTDRDPFEFRRFDQIREGSGSSSLPDEP